MYESRHTGKPLQVTVLSNLKQEQLGISNTPPTTLRYNLFSPSRLVLETMLTCRVQEFHYISPEYL